MPHRSRKPRSNVSCRVAILMLFDIKIRLTFFSLHGSTSNVFHLQCLIGIKMAAAKTTNLSRIKPHLLFSLSPEVAVAPPGRIQAWLIPQSGYYGWTLPTVGCPVWRICRQMAPTALIQLTAALTPRPASNLILVRMRPVMKKRALSLFWIRNLRTTNPTTTHCRARTWGRGHRGKSNSKPPSVSRRGDKETTGTGGAPSVTLAGSRLSGTGTLFGSSPIRSC